MQTRMFAFFSSSLPTATAVGCPSPYEPLITGFATEATIGSEGSKHYLFVLVGEARRRGGGTMEAAAK